MHHLDGSPSPGIVLSLKVVQIILNDRFYGAERVAYSLCKGLQSEENVKIVVVTSQALRKKFSELHDSSIYLLPTHEGNFLKRANLLLKEISYLRQIISKERPDVIHVHGQLARLLVLAISTKRTVVETLHGVGLTKGEAFQRLTHRASDLLAAIWFDGSVFYMSKIIDDYSRLRLLRPSAVIYNAIDEDFTKLISQASRSPIDGKYILWCGRLDALKGADLSLRAFARIGRRDVRLVFVGDGPQRNYLETLAKSLGVDGQTMFRGYVDEIEKASFFQHATAICVNLTHPGLSQSLLEAVFSGNPVIACYDSEVEQIFGENIALLKEPSASKLATILSETLERNERRDQPVPVTLDVSLEERFSLKYFTEQYLAFYSRLGSGYSD